MGCLTYHLGKLEMHTYTPPQKSYIFVEEQSYLRAHVEYLRWRASGGRGIGVGSGRRGDIFYKHTPLYTLYKVRECLAWTMKVTKNQGF